jgi:hypothetical protein
MSKPNKKKSLAATARRLAAIAERALSKLPEEEQEARVAAFARVRFTPAREKRAKPSSTRHTRASRVSARARE